MSSHLEKQIVDLQRVVDELTKQRTRDLQRVETLLEQKQTHQDKINALKAEFEPTIKTLNDKIVVLTCDLFQKDSQCSELLKEVDDLKTHLNSYEQKLYQQGQTKQTIFMNLPKKFKSYCDKEGLGFENPGTLLSVESPVRSLYDTEYMGYGVTMNFVSSSHEELETEEVKRNLKTHKQFEYDYDSLNESYVTQKQIFSNDYISNFPPETTNSRDEGSSNLENTPIPTKVTEQKLYVPNSVLEKHIAKLKHELVVKKTIYFSKEKRFIKIVDTLQNQNSLLEEERIRHNTMANSIKTPYLATKDSTTSQPFTTSPFSFASQSIVVDNHDLNAKIEAKFSKIEKKVASLKLKRFEQKVSQHATSPVNVPKKIYPNQSSKPFVKKVSQFTNYSLQKAKRYSEKQYSSGTLTSSSFLSFSDNSSFISNAYRQKQKYEWKPKPNVSSSSTHTKSFTYSFKKLFDLAPRTIRSGEPKVNDFVLKNPTRFKPSPSFQPVRHKKDFQSPLLPRTLFRNETPSFKSKWNATSLNQVDSTYKWFAKVSNKVGPILKWVPKVALK